MHNNNNLRFGQVMTSESNSNNNSSNNNSSDSSTTSGLEATNTITAASTIPSLSHGQSFTGLGNDLKYNNNNSAAVLSPTNNNSIQEERFYSNQGADAKEKCILTQAGLEEYSRSCYGQNVAYNHQKQSSYAQSEGYHSYVSSLDSSSTPFLDRLRQDSELHHSRNLSWSQDYVSIGGSNLGDNSPESNSSTETLKWLGSLSDLSVISHATSNSAISEVGTQNTNISPSQLVVHSSRVRTPQRHNSESVLFMKDDGTQGLCNNQMKSTTTASTSNLDVILDETLKTPLGSCLSLSDRSSRTNNRLFPISTYTEGSNGNLSSVDQSKPNLNYSWQSVADRISELEKNASSNTSQRYTFLDPGKTHLIPNPALKAIQKNAVQSYFERQQSIRKGAPTRKSDNQMSEVVNSKPVLTRPQSLNLGSPQSASMKNIHRSSMSGIVTDTQKPLQEKCDTKTGLSSISTNYIDPRNVIKRIANAIVSKNDEIEVPPKPPPRTRIATPVRRTSSAAEYSSIRNKHLPVNMNTASDWVPERPPKNPTLRVPSPELPPPPPPPPIFVTETEIINQDEPLPPPPEEILHRPGTALESLSRRNSFAGHSNDLRMIKNQEANELPAKRLSAIEKKIKSPIRNETDSMMHFKKPTVLSSKVISSENEQKISFRKRSYNMQNTIGIPLQPSVPPPLKPRKSCMASYIQDRSTSKASYLPCHINDKQVSSDHGSYKLKLNSNEDFVNNDPVPQMMSPGKCNLPDVLPLAVKYNNNNINNAQQYAPNKQKAAPQSAPIVSNEDFKSLFNFPKVSTQVPINDSPYSNYSDLIGTKYTSKSMLDLENTTPKDDPPPYTDDIKKEVIQHLELGEPMTHIPATTATKRINDIANNQDTVAEKLNPTVTRKQRQLSDPPSYEETQTQMIAPPQPDLTKEPQLPETLLKTDTTKLTSNDCDLDNSNPPQRTEVVLRLSPTTLEAAIQTDECIEPVLPQKQNESQAPSTPVAARRITPEEIDCDNLYRDLVSQLSPSDRLHHILVPPKTFRQSSDYVSDLFNITVTSRLCKKDVATNTVNDLVQESPDKELQEITNSTSSLDVVGSAINTRTNADLFDMKNKFVTHYKREMTLINGDTSDLTQKKVELVQRLTKKLKVLSDEQTTLSEENIANQALGDEVMQKITQKVKPSEASRYKSYVDDVGHITKLLLSLSNRLAATHNTLQNIEHPSPDKTSLESKRDHLLSQLNEAKQLKENIDSRGITISKILEKVLTIEEYADYDYFINMKAKLLIDSAEIANKIKLGEEQLTALKETLVHSEC